ncbi:MAG: metallophosphoesterase family protein [Anaerolineaceae bacterium]|nr:metallophosphoesterase family protein [Anaerolineaceae bacterium]
MTRLAVLADIHGNLPALEAVIADMQGEELDQVVVAGDLINGAPFSRQVLETVVDSGWVAIRGNHEMLFLEHLAESPGKKARRDSRWVLEMTAGQLGDHWRAQVAAMPDELTLRFADAPPLRILHGSAGNPFRTINRHTDETEACTLLSGVQEKSVVTAHCHLHFERRLAGRQVLNPGSVGAPLDGRTSAAYMLLNGDDSGWQAEFRRVPVNVGPLVAEFRRLDVERRWGAEGYLLVEQFRLARPLFSSFRRWHVEHYRGRGESVELAAEFLSGGRLWDYLPPEYQLNRHLLEDGVEVPVNGQSGTGCCA